MRENRAPSVIPATAGTSGGVRTRTFGVPFFPEIPAFVFPEIPAFAGMTR